MKVDSGLSGIQELDSSKAHAFRRAITLKSNPLKRTYLRKQVIHHIFQQLYLGAITLELGTDVLTNTSLLSLTTTDNTTVHGTRDAVLLLDVELGKSVLYASRGQSRKLRSYTEASRISL